MKKQHKKPDKKTLRIRRHAYFLSSMLFVCVLTAIATVSLDIPDRPSFSESEKRALSEFPELSAEALFSGDYFSGIDSWFSDTFPFRETLIGYSANIKKLLGMSSSIHNFSESKADDIPDSAPITDDNSDEIKVDVPDTTQDPLMAPALPVADATNSQQSQSGGEVLEQKFDAIYIYGNTAYEYYNFVQSTANTYISAINSAAADAKANGINFYNMIIPTSTDITLNAETRSKLNSSDQKNAINYMYSQMSQNVTTVPIYDLLKAHSNEYLYFRTDHHWTSLGAYYAYAKFMTVKGAQYTPLSEFTQYIFEPFLGSFYNDSGKSQELSKTPDAVYAYMPPVSNTFSMLQKNSSSYVEWPLICDGSSYSTSYKYLCFIGGDNPVSIIENTDMTEGETCVFVKESFGNAFAPYLICNYKYVYVIDYRYFDGDITDFAKEKGATDILVQNNISMTRNSSLVNRIAKTL